MRLLGVCFLIAAFAPFAYGACGTCSLSGDQHFITLDGAEHHYYGRGWHRLYQLDRFEVQCLFADCKTGAETLDGHRRRNDGRRVCLRACRAQFVPPGSVCSQILNWEPLQIDAQGHSQIEVNGARLKEGKGISQAAKDQSWWLRIERVGRDAAAIDVMLGGGAGGLSLRLGPKRIVTVTVKGLQGGRGLCGSCDSISSNDLAGATHLNVSDCDGHNRFADAHRRGAAGFALIPVKPECAGGTAINEQDEVNMLLKEAEEVKKEEESIHQSNEQFAMMGSGFLRDGAPDYDPRLIVPPVATFANQTIMETVIRDCQAGMLLTPSDERMQIAIDNCILDKARGRGFEIAAASNIVAYVQSLMINEQADLALQRLTFTKNFCAMCQSAIQTFVINTKPILRHTVATQAHWYDPGVVQYSALVPAPFELIQPELSPRPTNMPPLSKMMSIPKPIVMPEKNASSPKNMTALNAFKDSLLPSDKKAFIPPVNQVNPAAIGLPSKAPPRTDYVPIDDAVVAKPEFPPPDSNPLSASNSTQESPSKNDQVSPEPSQSVASKEKNSTATKPEESRSKKSKSDDAADSSNYHLKGSMPVSNEDEESDDDDDKDDDDSKGRRHKKGTKRRKKKKKFKLFSKKKHNEDDDDEDYDDNDDEDDDDDDDDDDDYDNDNEDDDDDDDGDEKESDEDNKKKSKSSDDEDKDGDDDDNKKKDNSKSASDAKKDTQSEAKIEKDEKSEPTPSTTPATPRPPVFPGSFIASPDQNNATSFQAPNAPPNLLQAPGSSSMQMPTSGLFSAPTSGLFSAPISGPSPFPSPVSAPSGFPPTMLTSNAFSMPTSAPSLFQAQAPAPQPDMTNSVTASANIAKLRSNNVQSPDALPDSLEALASSSSGVQPPTSPPGQVTTVKTTAMQQIGSSPDDEAIEPPTAVLPVVIKATPVAI